MKQSQDGFRFWVRSGDCEGTDRPDPVSPRSPRVITGRRRRRVLRQPVACAHPEPGYETWFDLVTRKGGKTVEIQAANDMIGEAATLEYIGLSLVVVVPICAGGIGELVITQKRRRLRLYKDSAARRIQWSLVENYERRQK